MKTPVLKTARLILRPVTLDDAPAIQRQINNWNVVQYLSKDVPWPSPDDGAHWFLSEVLLPAMERGTCGWALTEKDGPKSGLIGLVEYRMKKKTEEGGNRGFWLAEAFWRRGYMTEAVTAIQDWLFFEQGIESLTVVNAASNEGSRRVKEKTGARFVKHIELAHNSGDSKTEVWEITEKSWKDYRGRA